MVSKLSWTLFGLLCWASAAFSLGAPIFGLVGVLSTGRDPFLEEVGPLDTLVLFLYGSGALGVLLALSALFLRWVDRSAEREAARRESRLRPRTPSSAPH